MLKDGVLVLPIKPAPRLLTPNASFYLFTVVVENPITNKGVPVGWFITDTERTPIIVQWLQWLKHEIPNLPVKKKIMIDCSKAEIAAFGEVFGESMSVLLCHWYIKRAWEKNITSDIKISESTLETAQARSNTRFMLNNLMCSSTEELYFQNYDTFKDTYETQFISFFWLLPTALA